MPWMLRCYDDKDEVVMEREITRDEAKQLVGHDPSPFASNPVPDIIDLFVDFDAEPAKAQHKQTPEEWRERIVVLREHGL